MAQFRGTLQGNRGQASRLGTKATGLHAHLGSWEGGVNVTLSYNPDTGHDNVRVTLGQHDGAGLNPERVLYDGPVSGKRIKRAKSS